MDPSRCRCSSAFGREAMRLESKGGVIRERLVRQLRPAGVYPRRKPERAHIGCRVGELTNQNGGGLVVEAVVILVGEGILTAARVAVGEKYGLQPAMRTKTSLECAIRRVADEKRIIWPHREKRRIAVDQRGSKSLVDRRLAAQVTVKIIGRVEGIMRLRHVIREYGCVQFCFFPLPVLQCFGQFFTVHTNLPGKQAVRFQLSFAKLRYRGFVVARQGLKRKSPVLVESNEVIVPLGRSFRDYVQRIGDMLQQEAAVCVEELPDTLRQGVDGFVGDEPVPASSPCAQALRRGKEEHEAGERDSRSPPRMLKRQSLHSAIPLTRDLLLSECCASGRKNNRAPGPGSSRQRSGSSSLSAGRP